MVEVSIIYSVARPHRLHLLTLFQGLQVGTPWFRRSFWFSFSSSNSLFPHGKRTINLENIAKSITCISLSRLTIIADKIKPCTTPVEIILLKLHVTWILNYKHCVIISQLPVRLLILLPNQNIS